MNEPLPLATKRYLKRFIPTMGLYVVLLPLSIWLYRHTQPNAAEVYFLALGPAAPILAVIAIVGAYLKEADEFHRAILTQGMLWGLAMTLAITTVWGFLEMYGRAPHQEAYLVFPLFCAASGLAMPIVMRRYR